MGLNAFVSYHPERNLRHRLAAASAGAVRRKPPLLLMLFAAMLWLCASPVLAAQPTPPAAQEIAPDQIEDLIRTIEDPAQRERLLQQLRLLVQAKEAAGPSPATAAPVVAALATVSTRLEDLQSDALALVTRVAALPQLIDWVRAELRDPKARDRWRNVGLSLLAILGSGYVLYFVTRRLFRPIQKNVAQREAPAAHNKAGWLLWLLILDLVPIAAFAVGASLIAGVLTVPSHMRLAALGWINAIIAARILVVVGRALLAPRAPALRLWRISDEAARYGELWIRRFSVTLIYGFFVLQAAAMLGLDDAVHGGLRRLFGLVLLVMVVVLILQSRVSVRDWIARPGRFTRLSSVRRRIANVWHLVAIAYALAAYIVWAVALRDGFAVLARGTAFTIAAFAVGFFILKQVERAFRGAVRADAMARQRTPAVPVHRIRYLPFVERLVRGLVYILVALTVLQAWGMDTYGWLASEPGRVLIVTLLRLIAILGISLLIWEMTALYIERRLAAQDQASGNYLTSARTRTLLTVARKALALTLVVISSLLVLTELGVNIAPLLATAGVLGVAVGFGSQKLVQDVITGVFILLEDLFAVGDVIKVGDIAGQVEAVSIRNVRLRDASGTVHTIPFSTITTVSNLTRDYAFYVFNIGIAYSEDVDNAMTVLKEIGEEMRQDPQFSSLILAPFELVGVDRFSDAGVVIQARFKTQPIQQWTVGREFNRRMKKRFDELGIQLARGQVVSLAVADGGGGAHQNTTS